MKLLDGAPLDSESTELLKTPTKNASYSTDMDTKLEYLGSPSKMRHFSSGSNLIHILLRWLHDDARLHETPTFNLAGIIRIVAFDPNQPQQSWNQYAGCYLLLGIATGIYVGLWHRVISFGLYFIWDILPNWLIDVGLCSTDLVSLLYMPIVMSVGCGISGVGFHLSNVPDQNQLIDDLYDNGRTTYKSAFRLLLFSTIAMCSGLPLGPELPLLLFSAMFASWISASIRYGSHKSSTTYLASQAAAIGGFFQYPLGGALFVLELPHRTGIYHIFAVYLCLLSSIVSTVVHCAITGTDIAKLFDFGGSPATLSCEVLFLAALLSIAGTTIGVLYVHVVKYVKSNVNELMKAIVHDDNSDIIPWYAFYEPSQTDRKINICQSPSHQLFLHFCKFTAVGFVCSVLSMLYPHCFSWGEEQLQNLLDGGKSELPFFSQASPLVNKWTLCMPDQEGLGIFCLVTIPIVKSFMIALVLATGIRCGHFWGPLFVGAASIRLAVNFLEEFLTKPQLDPYECVVILALLASVHVVTFRSPLGITFILAQSMGSSVASIVVALISSLVAFYSANNTVFYKSQRDPYQSNG